ncbi:MAG: Ferredoxin-dependent glutamate synthase (EC [uncultured Thiotrichaceae bacterium]|uniref:Ferredoxin-dependent glutamate synthase (EC) n=1 Tax=uncultured Thiotrichaceae bacterium TaxID=298394 RepID=A0A6S6TLN4_9GAMM|nr:MAG: Ferredoxin-dependent glutamate synthase (EC [uncultured Thiotrichaceae bacterium]
MQEMSGFLFGFVEFAAALFIFLLGITAMFLMIVYIKDVTQTKQAVLRNYPVIGHFRYFFETLGEFFRQYFFAMDREELPFNRAQRTWVYKAGKNINNTVAFGSTKDLRRIGSVMFVNSPFPTLDEDAVHCTETVIGPYCEHPYKTSAIFCVSAMSYGAISRPAVRSLAHGARKANIWLNTGEGGLSPYHLEGDCDIVFQMGTAKNGVSDHDGNLDDDLLRKVAAHDQVKMFEIKLSQGAKPGKGGILPAEKVTREIAEIRHIPVGKAAISPNRHTDVNTNGELLDLIERIRRVTGKPVGFKAVISDEQWLDDLFTEVIQRGIESAPDFIVVDSADGGTGAAPLPLIDDMGLPLRESLPMLENKLLEYGLRQRVKIIASGKLVTPADVAWAICLGADFCVSARGFMFALGCIQALQCNKNTCPTGITTHNKDLQRGLIPEDKIEKVASYAKNLVHEVGIIAHSCGVKEPRQLDRRHARVVMENSLSKRLDELHPFPIAVKTESININKDEE